MNYKVLNLDDKYEIRDLTLVPSGTFGMYSYFMDEDESIYDINGNLITDLKRNTILNTLECDETEYMKYLRYMAYQHNDSVSLYGIIVTNYKNYRDNICLETYIFIEVASFSKCNIKTRKMMDNIPYEIPGRSVAYFEFFFHNGWDYGVTSSMSLIKKILGEEYYVNGNIYKFIDIQDVEHFLFRGFNNEKNLLQWNLNNDFLHNIELDKKAHRFCYIQKEKNDAIIRLFCKKEDFSKPMEYIRIRLSYNEISVYRNFLVGWEKIENYYDDILINDFNAILYGYDKDIMETSFKYYACHLKNIGIFTVRKIVYSILFPGIDNLLKLKGGNNFFIRLCFRMNNFIDENARFRDVFECFFGTTYSKETSFARMIGISQWMLEEFLKCKGLKQEKIIYMRILYTMKDILNEYRINHINKYNFFILLEFLLDIEDCEEDILKLLVESFGYHNLESYIDKLKLYSQDEDLYLMYKDYIEMLIYIKDDYPQFKWSGASNIDEMRQLHDNVMYIYNFQGNKQEIEKVKDKFEQVKKNWDKYIYSNGTFSIILPEEPMDIINEGTILHHCVKSYLDAVCDGKTTILFIRKNDDLKKPYYTLEIKDNGIRQCHGFANCNITAEISEFLHLFCEEKKIKYCNENKVLAVE